MAKSGLQHIDVGAELTKTEWESEESHELVHGNSFPGSPVERQLYYRDDEHKWYVYNGTEWVWLGGGGGGSDDMLKSVYDTDDDGVVYNSEKLEASTKSQVQDHTPKAHTLASHSSKAHSELTGVSSDQHHAQLHAASHENGGGDEISVAGLSGQLADAQPPKIHPLGGAAHNADTLANLNTKISDATLDDSGDPRDPNAHKTSHENGGGDEVSVEGLSGLLADDQHVLDAEVKAIKLDDFTAPDDNTDLDASSAKHGLMPKADKSRIDDGSILPDIVRAANFIMIPTAAGWTEVVTGSGSIGQQPFRNYANTGETASSTARCYAPAFGFNEGATYQYVNWDKELFLIFNYARYQLNALVEAWVQFAEQTSGVDLTNKGIGIVCKNTDLYGESYGTSRAETSLGVTLNNQEARQIVIHHSPGNFVKFYVGGVLKATHSVGANIPGGAGAAGIYLIHSIISSGAHSGFSTSNMMHGKIWQEL